MEDNTDDVGKAGYSDDDDEFEPSLEDLEDQLGPVERDPRRETGYGTIDIPPMVAEVSDADLTAAGHALASPQGAGARSKSPTVSRRQTDESPSPKQLQDQIDALQARLASTVRRKRYEQGTAGDSVRESTFGHVDAVGYVTRGVGVSPPKMARPSVAYGGGTYWPVADQPRLTVPDPKDMAGTRLTRPPCDYLQGTALQDTLERRVDTAPDVATNVITSSDLSVLTVESLEKRLAETVRREVAKVAAQTLTAQVPTVDTTARLTTSVYQPDQILVRCQHRFLFRRPCLGLTCRPLTH